MAGGSWSEFQEWDWSPFIRSHREQCLNVDHHESYVPTTSGQTPLEGLEVGTLVVKSWLLEATLSPLPHGLCPGPDSCDSQCGRWASFQKTSPAPWRFVRLAPPPTNTVSPGQFPSSTHAWFAPKLLLTTHAHSQSVNKQTKIYKQGKTFTLALRSQHTSKHGFQIRITLNF